MVGWHHRLNGHEFEQTPEIVKDRATDPLIHAKGSLTLLLQLGRKAHVHAPNRDED